MGKEIVIVWFTDPVRRYHYFRTLRKLILRKLYPNWGWSNARDLRDIDPLVFFKFNKEILLYIAAGFLTFIAACTALILLYGWLMTM